MSSLPEPGPGDNQPDGVSPEVRAAVERLVAAVDAGEISHEQIEGALRRVADGLPSPCPEDDAEAGKR